MSPAQIDGMIDQIIGIYPTANVSRNAMKAAWSKDEMLLNMDVNDARFVIPMVEKHDKIPSLPEIKRMFMSLRKAVVETISDECVLCDSTGWDSGILYDDNGRMLTEQYTQKFQIGNRIFDSKVVKRCTCSL